jgi:hypothetical protein
VIGFLHPDSPEVIASRLAAFRKGLGETGYQVRSAAGAGG